MNRLKSYIRITVLTLCVFVALAVQSLAESQRFALPATEAFIAKWSQSGGSELGSSQNFLLELCDLLEVPRPASPRADLRDNTYTFEKQVSLNGPGGKTHPDASTSTSVARLSGRANKGRTSPLPATKHRSAKARPSMIRGRGTRPCSGPKHRQKSTLVRYHNP